MIASWLVAALTLFDFESPEVRKLHPECVAKNAVGGDWSLCVTNAKPVELKLPLRDLTPYEKVVFDVVTVGSSGKVTLSSSFNNAKGGVRTRSVDLLCGGYERWEVDLFEWPEAIRPHDVDTLRLWLENPSGKDEVYVDNVTLTKPGEKLPPAPPMFQTMRQKAETASAERIVEENRVAHAKAYAAFAADCAAKGQAASSPYLLGEASPMEKVLPRGRNAPRALDVKKGLSVGLAKYEKEAVQLLVAPRKGDLRKVTVEAKGFAGLPLAAIECRVTGYVRTFLPPPYKVFEGTNTVSQAPEVGWWPDPILDYLPATDVRGEDIQSFWIRVRCPEDQKPGVYKGELVVRAEGEKPQAVPFAVRVYDFAVPKRAPYSQACTFSPGPNTQFESAENLAHAKRLAADPLGPCNAWKKHELAWGDFLADYYITMDNLYHRGDATKGIPHFDVLRRLKDQGRLDWFNLGYWSEPKELTDAAKAEWREKTLGRIGACYRKAKELGIDDHAYIYGCDEAAKEKFPQIRWAIDELKRAFPGVPVFTTAYDNEFGVGTALSGIDWFTPLTPEYRPAKAAAARKEGRQVWWYICCGPGNPYANMFIESPALEGRSLMGQQAVKYRPDGFLYYQLTLWNAERPIAGDSAFTDWTARSWTKLNGDGSWTCCGPDGTPLATQRLENFRDGLEDYAYAMELERRMKAHPGHPFEAKAKALLEVRDVRTLEDFTREPERIAAWRRALAETIEAYAVQGADLTEELQRAVDAAWRAGGGEVVVPAGEHRLSPIRLRSGVTLRLARGAHVCGVRDCEAYVGAWTQDRLEPIAVEDLRHAAGEDLTRRSQYALFTAFGAKDVRIVGEEDSFVSGENCPDACGAEWYRGPHVFSFACSTNVSFTGVCVRDSGDYAFRCIGCHGVTADGVSVRGGHDGIHFDLCTRVRVVNSDFRTGDDAVAGSGCSDVVVSNCVLNSACSPFRLGGRDVLVTDCRATGPAEYPHRWTLSREEKLAGAAAARDRGRRTVGCFYQAYTGDVAHRGFRPGNIVVRNTVVENAERFLLSVSGLPAALWQDGHGISDITFENVRATGLGLPAAVVAKADEPLTIILKDCSFAFRTPQVCAFFGKNVKVVDRGVRLANATRLFDERPDVSYDDVPEFPSWRVEPSEQRAKWGLPPLRGAPDEAAILETRAICVEPGRYVGWPTVCRRANGELLVVFSGDRDQHVCPWGKVQLIRSADDGRTWSEPVTIQNGILDDRDAGLVELRDGTLLLNWFTSIAYAVWNRDRPDDRGAGAQYVRHFKSLPREQVRAALGAWTARSTDGGRTWSKPVRTPGQLPHGVTELGNGRIVAVVRRMANEGQVLRDEPGFDQIGHHILCVESADGGLSWQVIGELEPGEGVKVKELHEPHLVELPDGRLLAQVRWHGAPVTNRWGGVVQAESTDGGRTWTKMERTPIVGFPPHLLNLADGRLLTVYGNRNRGCCGEYACLSEDGGRTWDTAHEICLSRHVDGDLGYPSSVQLADGTVLTVYYQPPAPNAPPAVMMTRWRPPRPRTDLR